VANKITNSDFQSRNLDVVVRGEGALAADGVDLVADDDHVELEPASML
jgi:hypothetical protein